MKQHWQRLALKIDALTLRERTIIFAMAALIVITLVNTTLLDPRFAKQKQLSQRIKQDQSLMAGLQAQMQQKTSSSELDPDKGNKQRLQELIDQIEQVRSTLGGMDKAMVSPEKMPELLEDILRQNQTLHLVSLKNWAPTPLAEHALDGGKKIDGATAPSGKSMPDAKLQAKKGSSGAGTVYMHGVEIVVQGRYLDLMSYLTQLEALPWQFLWAKAKLDVTDYPRSTLTLTLYTLSLDKKWLNL